MSIPPVERIYVAACKRDLHLTRLCVASIRYWHPKIPISLMIDDQLGVCDTSRLERDWKVDRFPTTARRFGGGTSKLEMFFQPKRERYLVLDSDIVLLGPILDLLDRTPGDFVVHPEVKSSKERDSRIYAVKPLTEFDPGFDVPPRVFNSGQYVGTSGLLHREDFDAMLEWLEPRRPRRPDIFKIGDQGMLNYVLVKAEREGRLSITWQPMFLWKRHDTSEFTLEKIAARTTPPMLLHWCGYKADDIALMERPDILAFYADFERKTIGWSSRLAYWLQDQSAKKWRSRMRGLRNRCRFWLKGTPLIAGGPMNEIPPGLLHQFHEIEKADGLSWRWSYPEAAIELPLPPGDYRVRIETGSPSPMTDLAERNLHCSINDQPLTNIRITGGVAEFDLCRSQLKSGNRQVLQLALNRMDSPQDERPLGMPVCAVHVLRLRN